MLRPPNQMSKNDVANGTAANSATANIAAANTGSPARRRAASARQARDDSKSRSPAQETNNVNSNPTNIPQLPCFTSEPPGKLDIPPTAQGRPNEDVLGESHHMLRMVLESINASNQNYYNLAKRVDDQENTTKHHSAQLKELSDKFDKFIAQYEQNLKQPPRPATAPLIRASSAEPRVQTDSTNPALVRIRANNTVGRDAVVHVFAGLAKGANLDPLTDYEILPKLPQNNAYRAVFSGDAAAAKAKQFLDSLRLPTGKYKPTDVEKPRGGTEHLYLGPDRSRTEIAKSRNLKILARILADRHPGKQFVPIPQSGSITLDWITLVALKPDDGFSAPHWTAAATDEGLNTTQISTEFVTATAKYQRPPSAA